MSPNRFVLRRAILFDLDGTLLDSLPGIHYAALQAFHACGISAGEVDLRSLIGPPIRTILSRMCPPSHVAEEGELDQLEKAFRISYDHEGWRKSLHYEGVAHALNRMVASGRRLFVVSNKPRHISLKILSAEGTLEFFEAIVTRDSRQPPYQHKTEMISFILKSHGMSAVDCMMVGDTMEDAEAAAASGMKFCLMTYGYGDVPIGSVVPVALRLDTFAGFLQFLEDSIQM